MTGRGWLTGLAAELTGLAAQLSGLAGLAGLAAGLTRSRQTLRKWRKVWAGLGCDRGSDARSIAPHHPGSVKSGEDAIAYKWIDQLVSKIEPVNKIELVELLH